MMDAHTPGYAGAEMAVTCTPRCMHAEGPASECRCTRCGGLAHGIAPCPPDLQLELFPDESDVATPAPQAGPAACAPAAPPSDGETPQASEMRPIAHIASSPWPAAAGHLNDEGGIDAEDVLPVQGQAQTDGEEATAPARARADGESAALVEEAQGGGRRVASAQPRAGGGASPAADREGDAQGELDDTGAAAWRDDTQTQAGAGLPGKAEDHEREQRCGANPRARQESKPRAGAGPASALQSSQHTSTGEMSYGGAGSPPDPGAGTLSDSSPANPEPQGAPAPDAAGGDRSNTETEAPITNASQTDAGGAPGSAARPAVRRCSCGRLAAPFSLRCEVCHPLRSLRALRGLGA